MKKFDSDKYKSLSKQTLSEIALNFSDDPAISRIQLDDAIKTLMLLYINVNPKPTKHYMESVMVQSLNSCRDWYRDISAVEYPNEPMYSKKKVDIKKFIE
jgi:hypothetical protein